MNPNDMGMSQFEAALCLTLQLIKHRTILNHQVGDKFQRNIPLQSFVACQPDNSHSAARYDLDHRVAAKATSPAGEPMRPPASPIPRASAAHADRLYII